MSSSIRTAARFLETKGFTLLRLFGAMGGVLLLAMMMVVVVDAIGRRFFGQPIQGTYEAVSFLLVLLVFLAMGYCGAKKGHFVINLVTSHLQLKVRLIIVTITYFVSAVLCWGLGRQLVVFALHQKAVHATGREFTFVPVYPFILVAAFCSLVLGCVFLVQTMYFLREATERRSSRED